MASPNLALPGALFVGEDDRGRLVAHLGPAAGWMIPHGVLGWSTEVSVVARDAITDSVKGSAKIVMPEEQIPTGKYPLAHQAALKSPLIAVSSRLTQKLVDSGIRVHTVGADRVTSSFYYLAEGGGEEPIRIEGDLVAAVGAMLGDRADNAAIERVLDGLVDRLVRSLSKDRVTELSLELAHALPRAAADGSGLSDIDLDGFEKELSALVGGSEKYKGYLEEISTKITSSNEQKVEIPLFGDAKKVSQGPFELEVGSKKVALVTHQRWLATGPLTEPKPGAKPAATTAAATPAAKTPEPKPVAKAEPKADPKPAPAAAATPKAEPAKKAEPAPAAKAATPKPAAATPAAASPKPAEVKPAPTPIPSPKPAAAAEAKPAAAEAKPAPAAEPKTTPMAEPKPAAAEPAKVEPAKAEPKPEPKPEPAKAEPVAAKAETPAEPKTKTMPIKESTPGADPAIPKAAATPSDLPKTGQPLVTKAQRDATANPRDARMATTTKTKKEKGFPWLWIAVAVAAIFAGYRLWAARRPK